MKLLSLSALALGLSANLAVADVRVEGPIEYGVFASAPIKDPQPGERILSRANQPIEPAEVVPSGLLLDSGVAPRRLLLVQVTYTSLVPSSTAIHSGRSIMVAPTRSAA